MKNLFSIFFLTFFIFSCSKEDKLNKNAVPGIKVLNESSVSTSKIESWTSYASKKMKDQNADILAVCWDVGSYVKEGGFDKPFNTHEVIISQNQIETLITGISEWLDKSCLGNNDKKAELKNYREYLEKGADASTQLDVCPKFRILLMAFTKEMKEEAKQGLVLHELYHAFQHDLPDNDCRKLREKSDTNAKWIVEGGAEYFNKVVSGEMNNEDGVSNLLKMAYDDYQSSKDPSITGDGIATRGAAGIRLMIERGLITESVILDGSFFHSCSSENEWSNDNSNVAKIKNRWYLIEEKNGKYVFTAAALGG